MDVAGQFTTMYEVQYDLLYYHIYHVELLVYIATRPKGITLPRYDSYFLGLISPSASLTAR